MNDFVIPSAVLGSHSAILGKTGSGKTSTSKLFVERVVEEGARVCILDPIKSDWWGITSNGDGTAAGLPFCILGGPRGHVGLHSSAGAVIGKLVAEGKIPLSIIDMARFEPGGLQKFFVDFADALMRDIQGVLYLVVEEAHEFAPKERAGIEKENLTLHWMKRLATAGRSKGIRLIVATQRVQSLHNAVLGSCETMVAHRLTAPADQKPIIDWLKANTDKSTADAVAASLSSLPTGTGWLCSGEAKIFEKVAFPKFHTFDNAATPTGNDRLRDIHTAPVDQAELKSIIGEAAEDAKANDPKTLRAEIERLKKGAVMTVGYTDADIAREVATATKPHIERIAHLDHIIKEFREINREMLGIVERTGSILALETFISKTHESENSMDIPAEMKTEKPPRPKRAPAEGDATISRPQQAILDTLANLAVMRMTVARKDVVALFSGASPTSGAYANNLGKLRTAGLIEYPSGGMVALTPEGHDQATTSPQPLTLTEFRTRWYALLSTPQVAILKTLVSAYPNDMSKPQLAAAVDASPTSGSFANNLGRLRTLGLLDYPKGGYVVATASLFPEGLR